MSLPILRTGLACALVHVTGLGVPTSHCHSGAGARSKTTSVTQAARTLKISRSAAYAALRGPGSKL